MAEYLYRVEQPGVSFDGTPLEVGDEIRLSGKCAKGYIHFGQLKLIGKDVPGQSAKADKPSPKKTAKAKTPTVKEEFDYDEED